MDNQETLRETTLNHESATVIVSELSSGRRKISIKSSDTGLYIHQNGCETLYPVELIQQILEVKGPGYLCDEIARDESPEYAAAALRWTLLAYIGKEEFQHTRLLDFGCGAGASTCGLARMFPSTEIVGVELEEELLSIAKSRAKLYDFANVEFYLSPNSDNLPEKLGEFDYIVLTGVYEHLLPQERKLLLPQLWSLLKVNGVLFIHETPHRYFPVETHTTGGLPFINYLPDRWAFSYARRFSKRQLREDDWGTLLRKGIRGGNISEMFSILSADGHKPRLMEPSRVGVKDRIDLWYLSSEKSKHGTAKKLIRISSKMLKFLTKIELVPYLELAFKKVDPSCENTV